MLKRLTELARRWLKLPEGNPQIPAGDPASVQVWNPDAGYLRYRKFGFWFGALPMLFLAAVFLLFSVLTPLAFLVGKEEVPGWLGPMLTVVFLLVGAFLLFVIAFNWAALHLELDMLRYTLTDRAIRLRRGVVGIQEVTLSYANIQNVKFQQGPLQRHFGIGDLVVETAGGGGGAVAAQQAGTPIGQHQGLIKGISKPDELRELILERVRAAKGAGLGDAAHEEHEHVGAGSVDSPEGRALLREIRDGLRRVQLDDEAQRAVGQ